MTLDPAIEAFITATTFESLDHLSIPGQRQVAGLVSDLSFLRFGEPGPAVHSVSTTTLSSDSAIVRLRIFRPTAADRLPVHLVLHGGGWWLGSIDELIVDATCRERAAAVPCVVIAVDYRLAPENCYPAALDDAFAALNWVVDRADELGIDPGNISVGGASAGANLAAALAIRCRDESGPPIKFQLLEVPALDLSLGHTRASGVPARFGPTIEELERYVRMYVDKPSSVHAPWVSPLLAEDLSRLPPAHIMTAQFDPLRDDGEQYAVRLSDAGVRATSTRHAGAIHGSIGLTRTWAGAKHWRTEVLTTLRQAHESGRVDTAERHPESLGARRAAEPAGESGAVARLFRL